MIDKIEIIALYMLIVIVTGYIGYSVANQSYRENERKDELLYGILTCGLIGSVIFYAFTLWFTSSFMILIALILSVITSWLFGVFWRNKGRSWYFEWLYNKGITNDNNLGTVWNRLQQDTSIYLTQITVTLNDGTKYSCDDVRNFEEAAVPLCETDNQGNIALYVTKEKLPEWEFYKEVEDVRHKSWGDQLTYIPSKEIKLVEFRYLKNK